jgi:hypothetical protein
MFSKYWQVIRDDDKRTFEVCGKASDTNSFTNNTHRMQKAGMNVTCDTPPVSTKIFNKDMVKVVGYTKEDGLYERLMNKFREITMREANNQE